MYNSNPDEKFNAKLWRLVSFPEIIWFAFIYAARSCRYMHNWSRSISLSPVKIHLWHLPSGFARELAGSKGEIFMLTKSKTVDVIRARVVHRMHYLRREERYLNSFLVDGRPFFSFARRPSSLWIDIGTPCHTEYDIPLSKKIFLEQVIIDRLKRRAAV